MYHFLRICVQKIELKINLLQIAKADLHHDTFGAFLHVASGLFFQKWGLTGQYLIWNQLYEDLNFHSSRETFVTFSLIDRPMYRLTAAHRK